MLTTFQILTENPISFYLFVEQVNPKIKCCLQSSANVSCNLYD